MDDADRKMTGLIADLDQRWTAAVHWLADSASDEYADYFQAIKRGDWPTIRRVADQSPKHARLLSRLCVLAMDEIATRLWRRAED
jgi:hypothetical protein